MPSQSIRDDEVRLGEVAFDLAEDERALVGEVGAKRLVDQRRVRRERSLGVDDRVERLVLHFDQVGAVLGQVAAVGEHDGDALADVANLVGRQQAPYVLVGGGAEVRQRVGQLDGLGAGHDHHDAGQLPRRLRVDADDPGVCVRASYERRVEHPGDAHVVDVVATATQELRILDAANRLADPLALSGVIAGGRMLGGSHRQARIRSAPSSTASMMNW